MLRMSSSSQGSRGDDLKVVVDTSQAPVYAQVGAELKQFIENWQPKIVDILDPDGFEPPHEIKLIFSQEWTHQGAGAVTSGTTMWFKAEDLDRHPAEWFFGMLVHEMVHTNQRYGGEDDFGWMTEGIADYVRYFHFEPGVVIDPHPDDPRKYKQGYGSAARFLAWIEKAHDRDIVKRLHSELSHLKYKESVFKDYTSVSLDDLWKEFAGSVLTTTQLFYRGTDNKLCSCWRNPDGSWSDERHIGGVLNGDPIAAVVPGTNFLQLFYRGTDNNVWSRWRNPDGSWSDEQHIGGVLNGDPIAAVVPGTNVLQLFYRGPDNKLCSRWRNPDGSWSAEQHIGGVLNGDPIAAVVPGTNVLELFYRGPDNNLWTCSRNPDGSWSAEQHIGGVLNGDPIAAVVPGTNVLQLFYRGPDNNLCSRLRNPDGSWSGEQHIGGVLNGDPIAAVVSR